MTEEQNIKQIPKGWVVAKFSDVCKFSQGIQVDIHKQSNQKSNGQVRFLRIIDFTQEDEPERYIDDPGEKYLLKKDEIAMVRYGTVGFVCTGKEGVIANNLFKITPTGRVNKKYLINFLNSYEFKGKLKTKGATMQALSFGMINPIPVPIPPLDEQVNIVSKIEELFSELDKGIEELKTAQQQLKVYRQAVLKWAFEGKLTNEDVKEGELPEGWKDAALGEYVTHIGSGKSYRCEERPPQHNQVGIVKVSSVTWGFFDEEESKTCFSNDLLNENYLIKRGDFLFSRANTIELIGACVIVKSITKRLMLSDKILRFTFSDRLSKDYALYFLRSRRGRKEIETLSTGNQDSMRNIGQEKIRQISIPIPKLREQQQIVQEIESRLSVCDKIEETITNSLKQSEALRQSILKKAFEGKLI